MFIFFLLKSFQSSGGQLKPYITCHCMRTIRKIFILIYEYNLYYKYVASLQYLNG